MSSRVRLIQNLLLLSLWVLTLGECAYTQTGSKRTLVPAKRALTLEARDLWKRSIIPKDRVQLEYGLCKLPISVLMSFRLMYRYTQPHTTLLQLLSSTSLTMIIQSFSSKNLIMF